MLDKAGEARRLLNEMNDVVDEVKTVLLRLYDGCGMILEIWTLQDVKMTLSPYSDVSNDEDIVPDWLISYQKCDYKLMTIFGIKVDGN